MTGKNNILFFGANKDSPAYKFYYESFSKIKNYNLETDLDFDKINNDFYKFIFLHTGYKKKFNLNFLKCKSKLVLVEPRTGHFNEIEKFDFLILNSFDSKLFFSKYKKPSLIYPPLYEHQNFGNKNKDYSRIRLVYHGNDKHISIFKEKLKFILSNLKIEKKIELHLIYNVKKKKLKFFDKIHNTNVFHHQYSEDVICEVLCKADIGIVPQLLPEKRNFLKIFSFFKSIKYFNDLKNEYVLRYKENSNIGRHLIFAQFKVPIVTEPTMSSILLLNDDFKDFIAYNKYDWLNSITRLIEDKNLAKNFGNHLYEKWKNNFTHDLLNNKLLNEIEKLNEDNKLS